MAKRIAVVGAGAVGGYAAAHMTAAGHDVTLIDPWPQHVAHMKAHGMEIFGMTPQERMSVRVNAMHVTEARGRGIFRALRGELSAHAAERLTATQLHRLDPESAAKRILAHALASDAAAELTAPEVPAAEPTLLSITPLPWTVPPFTCKPPSTRT